ncbi:serine-rich adhesin for platelets isoform X2 [Linepithema humile]|uniref:serine-rich adhesin for platelets isoform X2 n=1 Tax=Linepithema humile TaxID=83485 RepID=UPI00351F5201
MAGGRNDSKQNGNLNKTHQKLCYNCLDSFAKSESSLSDGFKEQKGAKEHRTIVNSISQLQDTILRNKNQFLICKAYQHLQEVKEYAVADTSPAVSEMADSGLETGSTSPHENTTSENSSTDFELVQAAEYTSATDDDSDRIHAERVRNKCGHKTLLLDEESLNCESLNSEYREKSATQSESNNYSTTCSSSEIKNQSADTSQNAEGAKLNVEEIFQYESRMLNEPFYESECGSDENGSFEYIEPIASASGECEKTSTECKLEQEVQPDGEKSENVTTETQFDRSRSADVISSRDSSSTSGYYFIDASTLNDEVDIMSTNVTQNQYATSAPLSYLMFSSNYTDCTTNKSNNTTEDQTYKFTPLKTLTLQGGHERVAEFERELKLTEYLQPFPESRKVKRVDSTSEEKVETSKPTVKESLAVEIKETDSGESAHPSPCPDNNTKLNNERSEKTDTSPNIKTGKNENDKDVSVNEDRRSSLIRRNTFELDSNDEKLSVLRQEYERRQGNLIFQSSIPQYSGHRVDGDSIRHVLSDSSVVPPITEPSITFISPDVQVGCDSQQPASYVLDNCKCEISQTPTQKSCLPSSLSRSCVVYPVIKSASDKTIMDYGTDSDETSNHCSSSLPVTLDSILEKGNRTESVKRTKRDEATPIISGGVSTSDYLKPTESISSPHMRRKMESTPIVSGGSVMMSKSEVKPKPRMSSSMTAWVVDMSDCNNEESKSRSSSRSMSQSFSTSECARKPLQRSNNHEKHGSLGFFVNLKEMSDEPVKRNCPVEKKERDSNDKSYCEFYVDISDESNGVKGKSSERQDTSVRRDTGNEGEKKNIFSMFIGLNDTCEGGRNVAAPTHRRSFSTVTNKLTDIKTDDSASSNSSAPGDNQLPQEEKKEKTKPSVFMFIESDSPIVRRRTLSTSRPTFKRHSWNVDKTQLASSSNGSVAKELMFRKEHKRAHSVSMDNRDTSKRSQAKTSSTSSTSERANSLNDTAKAEAYNHQNFKILQKSENNSNNMDTSSEDVFEFDVRDTPPNSHVEIIATELRASVNRCDYEEMISDQIENLEANETKAYEDEFSETSAWEKTCTESTEGQTRKSETFDISSGSGPSPDSDNHDDYELTDLLNGQVSGVNERSQKIAAGNSSKISETRKSLSETIKKIECELKEPEYNDAEQMYGCRSSKRDGGKVSGRNVKSLHLDSDQPSSTSFVRLSDLDKTPIVDHASDVLPVRDDRSTWINSSISETSWIESKLGQGTMRSSGPVRPVSRKLASVMSTSLPAKQKSPLEDFAADCEGEGIISESDLSSMQSSMGRSGAEGSTEETETSSIIGAKPYNRLGEDLLRMFLEEINPDVTIDVAGRHIRAHKCILSSRCQYFAAMLSGGWIESAGNVISLPGYSYNAVHFALCHIYSGESNIPDSISIVELATLADMLCLEGLKEVIGYTLKLKYCHLFHKPCQICAVGVLECMPLAAAYGLDEVYRKSLRWITKHFVRIWPCKAFATLPRELMEKCYHQHIVHMSIDNVLQTIMDCDKLLAILPNVRWAEPVFQMVSNLLETSVKFLSENFASVLGNENFQSLGREQTWNISRLEDNFLVAAEQLSLEQACKSYSKLNKMLLTSQTDDLQGRSKWGPLFIDFLHKLQGRIEKCLVRDAARAARTTTWLKMDLELRRRIQELACLVILPHESSKHLSRHSNFLKESRASPNHSTMNRSLDLKRVKMAISEHNDKTLKQVSSSSKQPKKVLCKPKTDPLERKMQEDKQATSETVRPKSWPNKIEVKSRYLEPRNKPIIKESVSIVHHDKINVQQRRKIMISSSDSSRTSSPAMKRATDKKPLSKIKLPVRKDIKALSSDSLTEANAARTGNKKDLTSKSCGITRPESPSFKRKNAEIGLSIDSLETKSKPVTAKKKANKMDTSMSTDSLMTEITATPKSNASNKLSPILTKTTNKTQIYDRTKKSSPPTQQRSPLTVTRRPLRSLESSTAASRSRAAAISSTYQGSPSLRRSLLDAAKTPDISSKPTSTITPIRMRQVAQTNCPPNMRRERKETQNSQSSDSPSKKSSPKSGAANKSNKSMITGKRIGKVDDKIKKCHNGETQKQPTVGSRSGTFLKDEPTILKKVDIKSSQINT